MTSTSPEPRCGGRRDTSEASTPTSLLAYRDDAIERGEARPAGNRDECLDVRFSDRGPPRGGVQIAPESLPADAPTDDLLAVDVVRDAPVGKRRDPLMTRHELKDRQRQL